MRCNHFLRCLSQARILNLEAEVDREKSKKDVQNRAKHDEKLTESLKETALQARKDAERLEKEYITVAEERDKMKNELEEMKRMYAALERRMKAGKNDTNFSLTIIRIFEYQLTTLNFYSPVA